jgi:hypothetical protein
LDWQQKTFVKFFEHYCRRTDDNKKVSKEMLSTQRASMIHRTWVYKSYISRHKGPIKEKIAARRPPVILSPVNDAAIFIRYQNNKQMTMTVASPSTYDVSYRLMPSNDNHLPVNWRPVTMQLNECNQIKLVCIGISCQWQNSSLLGTSDRSSKTGEKFVKD